jgi:hypothetical protein
MGPRRLKQNVAPKYVVYRGYASDSNGSNFSTTPSEGLSFMAEVLSEFVINPSKVNAALFDGKWVRYIFTPPDLRLVPETILVSVDYTGINTDLPITAITGMMIYLDDDIANWTITIENESNCTATVVSKNIRIDTITADIATLDVVANKAGYDEIRKTLTVKKVYDGSPGTVDDSTIQINGSGKLEVKDAGITTEKLEYKEFVAIVNFNGVAPSITVIKDTITSGSVPEIVWNDTGKQYLNIYGILTVNKTNIHIDSVMINHSTDAFVGFVHALRTGDIEIALFTSDIAGSLANLVGQTQINVRVYP